MSDIPTQSDLQALLTPRDAGSTSGAQARLPLPEAVLDMIPQDVQQKIADKLQRVQQALLRLEVSVRAHDAKDPQVYRVQSPYGDLTLRQNDAQAQRPPVGTRFVMTLSAQDLTLRSSATPLQLDVQLPVGSTLQQGVWGQLTPVMASTLSPFQALTQTSLPPQTMFVLTALSAFPAQEAGQFISADSTALQGKGATFLPSMGALAQGSALETPALPAALRARLVDPFVVLGSRYAGQKMMVATPDPSATVSPGRLGSAGLSHAALSGGHANGTADIVGTHSAGQRGSAFLHTVLMKPVGLQASVSFDGQRGRAPVLSGQAGAGTLLGQLVDRTQQGQGIIRIMSGSMLTDTQGSAGFQSLYALSGVEDDGLFLLPRDQAQLFKTGTLLQIQPDGSKGAAAATDQAARLNTALMRGADGLPLLRAMFLQADAWPSMTELLQTLQTVAPTHAAQFTATLPSAQNPALMMPAMLFFITAIRSGDLNSWLGDKTVSLLEKAGKHKVLRGLQQDMQALSRLQTDASGGEWRSHAVPFYQDGQIHKVLLHTHQEGTAEQGDATKAGQTRFLFEMSLSHIGPLQLDGLYQLGRLDLIVRVHQPFSKAMQAVMQSRYIQVLEDANLAGQLRFQQAQTHWVTVTRRVEDTQLSLES